MCLYTMVLMMNKHTDNLLGAKGIIGDDGTCNFSHPGSLPLPQTIVLKATGVHCPWHLQCHLGQTAQMDPDIPDEAEGIKRKCV